MDKMESTVKVVLVLMLCAINTSIAQSVLQYKVVEERRDTILLGNVAIAYRLDQKYTAEIFRQLRYSFSTDVPAELMLLFSINPVSSELSAIRPINREAVCPDNPAVCNILIVVDALPQFERIRINIQVIDINDNPPSFEKSSITLSVIESLAVGSPISLPGAKCTDKDSGNYSVQTFSLTGANADDFKLNAIDNFDGSHDLSLTVAKQLDRETRDSYQLTINARDGGIGTDQKSDTLTLNINIEDFNDNSPTFANDTYTVSLDEHTSTNTVVFDLNASDLDAGTNGEIVYSFSSRTTSVVRQRFDLDSQSGEIRVKANIYYSSDSKSYLLYVEARDKGTNSRPARATVIVNINDVINDNAPAIRITRLSDKDPVITAYESAPIGTPVALVFITDNDGGVNGQVDCNIRGTDFELVQLYSNEYKDFKAVLKTPLNREVKENYTVTVHCSDRGQSRKLQSTKTFIVVVGDENDQRPKFEHQTYSGVMHENNHPGASVLRVHATDGDKPGTDNSRIQYSIISGPSSVYFHIDANTGVITARDRFDRERRNKYEFAVTASDNGNPKLDANSTVVVMIKDTNDHSPQFVQSVYKMGIAENQPMYSHVGTVSATDNDEGSNAVVWYSIDPLSQDSRFFTVDALSGRITTNGSLDREKQAIYRITVIGHDRGLVSLTGSASVVIDVNDRNDNKPIITYPNKGNSTKSISYGTPVGITVMTVHARDNDATDNTKLTFYMSTLDGKNIFSVDEDTGDVLVMKTMSLEDVSSYNMVVGVRDGGTPVKTATIAITISVTSKVYQGGNAGKNEQDEANVGPNLTIVIALTSVSGFLSIVLIIAIIMIRRQDKDNHRYNCRSEARRTYSSNTSAPGPDVERPAHKEGSEYTIREKRISSERSDSGLMGSRGGRHSPIGDCSMSSSGTLTKSNLDDHEPLPEQETITNTAELIYKYARDRPDELTVLTLQNHKKNGPKSPKLPNNATSKDMEVQDIIDILRKENNQSIIAEDGASVDLSIHSSADSGQGGSEEDIHKKVQQLEATNNQGKKKQESTVEGPLNSCMKPKQLANVVQYHQSRSRMSSDSGFSGSSAASDTQSDIDPETAGHLTSAHVPSTVRFCVEEPHNDTLGRQYKDNIKVQYYDEHREPQSPKRHKINPMSHLTTNDSTVSQSESNQYSVQDLDNVLEKTGLSRSHDNSLDTSSSTNKSVDANQLCEEINELFFSDMMV